MKSLLTKNPYIDDQGRPIPFKGIKLRRVDAKFCDHHTKSGKCMTDHIILTAVRCGNCQKEYWMVVDPKGKCVCPSCRSSHMIPMKEGEINV
jgi:hypothetical protein